jgi:hypothetical protein
MFNGFEEGFIQISEIICLHSFVLKEGGGVSFENIAAFFVPNFDGIKN